MQYRKITMEDIEDESEKAYIFHTLKYEPYDTTENMHHNCDRNTCRACVGGT